MIQIVSIPLLLTFFKVETYAIWLLSYNIAQISGLLDFGSIAYSQHKLSDLNAQRRIPEIESHLKQVINILALNFVFFLGVITLIEILRIKNLNTPLISIFVCLFFLQSLWGLLEALTRFDSKISTGLYTSNALRLGEFLGTMIGVILFSDSLIEVGLVTLFLKLMTFVFLLRKLASRYRFLIFGRVNLSHIVSILKGSFPFFLIKMADTIYLSGFLIVLHGKVSNGQFVLFVALRTFFRLGLQVTSLISHSYAYEMSSIWVKRDLKSMQNLISSSNKVNFLFSCAGFFAYFLFGKYLFMLWVDTNIFFDNKLIACGACYSFILSLSQNQKTKFYAINHGLLISIIQIAFSSTLVLFISLSSFHFSVIDLFILLSIFELFCFITVAVTTRDSIQHYFESSDIFNSRKEIM